MKTLHLTEEHSAALARLDADLAIAATGFTGNGRTLHSLRRQVLDAYRSALAAAAGIPSDPHWHVLAIGVGTFIACVSVGARSQHAVAALARLWLLRLELLPELPHAPAGNSARNASSSRISIPSDSAFVSFEPASSPATT
jgi:hypothetical protein